MRTSAEGSSARGLPHPVMPFILGSPFDEKRKQKSDESARKPTIFRMICNRFLQLTALPGDCVSLQGLTEDCVAGRSRIALPCRIASAWRCCRCVHQSVVTLTVFLHRSKPRSFNEFSPEF